MESHALAEQVLKEFRSGGAVFADRLIAEVAFAEGVRQLITFDRAFARQPPAPLELRPLLKSAEPHGK